MDNLATQVVHELKAAPTRMAINTTIGGERFEDAAISTLRQGAGHAIGATLAHQIGQLYQGPDKLGYITHKLAHFASGALTGKIMANDPLGGAFSAAYSVQQASVLDSLLSKWSRNDNKLGGIIGGILFFFIINSQ